MCSKKVLQVCHLRTLDLRSKLVMYQGACGLDFISRAPYEQVVAFGAWEKVLGTWDSVGAQNEGTGFVATEKCQFD